MINIPKNEFQKLVSNIRRGLEKPKNKAALFIAKTSLETLQGYNVEESGPTQRNRR